MHLLLAKALASQHLLILKDAGLLKTGGEGKKIFYSANYSSIAKAIALVNQLIAEDVE